MESKDELKKIWMEKMKEESQIEMKLARVQARSPQERQMIVAIEHYKIVDQIFLKHGIRKNDLLREVKHQKIDSDPDVRAL